MCDEVNQGLDQAYKPYVAALLDDVKRSLGEVGK
jgi:hypothetical protein